MKKLKFAKLPFSIQWIIAFALGVVTTMGVFHSQNVRWHESSALHANLAVCFTPGQNCTALIESVIKDAHHSILVQAYSFTSEPIMQALINAHTRGVEVVVLVDKSQLKEKHTKVWQLKLKGITVLVDSLPGIAHNKVMIIDDRIVTTGSFNWTNAAQYRNAENLLKIEDSEIVRFYKENWQRRLQNTHITKN